MNASSRYSAREVVSQLQTRRSLSDNPTSAPASQSPFPAVRKRGRGSPPPPVLSAATFTLCLHIRVYSSLRWLLPLLLRATELSSLFLECVKRHKIQTGLVQENHLNDAFNKSCTAQFYKCFDAHESKNLIYPSYVRLEVGCFRGNGAQICRHLFVFVHLPAR